MWNEDGTTWNWKKGLENIPVYGVLAMHQMINRVK